MDLSETDLKVLIIIKDYLNQNRIFNAKKIIPSIMKGIKPFGLELDEKELQKILWRFIRDRIVVPGSKLTKDNVLENQKRKSIFNHIDKNPGTYIREIMNKLNLGSHEALWHINMLLKFELIRSTKIGRYKAYFNAKLPSTADKEMFYLGDPTVNEIIQTLYKNGEGMLINQIATVLNIHFNTVKSALEKLSEMQLLTISEAEGQSFYFINLEKFKEVLDKIEAIKDQ
ncbi:MAG: hypothetical protein ACTSR8_10000 [Promethearchaeota archaeon]